LLEPPKPRQDTHVTEQTQWLKHNGFFKCKC